VMLDFPFSLLFTGSTTPRPPHSFRWLLTGLRNVSSSAFLPLVLRSSILPRHGCSDTARGIFPDDLSFPSRTVFTALLDRVLVPGFGSLFNTPEREVIPGCLFFTLLVACRFLWRFLRYLPFGSATFPGSVTLVGPPPCGIPLVFSHETFPAERPNIFSPWASPWMGSLPFALLQGHVRFRLFFDLGDQYHRDRPPRRPLVQHFSRSLFW